MLDDENGSGEIGGHLLNGAGDTTAKLDALAANYETESVIVVSLGALLVSEILARRATAAIRGRDALG